MNFGLIKKLCLSTLFGVFLLPSLGHAYDTVTHRALTGEIADFFNASSGLKLTPRERELMMHGSIEEDAPSRRVLNHFYDPVRNIGLNDGHSAKEWAISETFQEYSTAGGGNYSWPQILKDYGEGNEERAFRGLGHILHLIEDMATPDHTRNDSHLTFNILGFSIHLNTNESPYEEWAKQKDDKALQNLGENLFAPGVEIYTFSNLGEAFDAMAGYANGNFFSKDTITGDKYSNFVYENPKITEFDENYGYGVDKLSTQPQKLIVLTRKDGKVNFQLSTEDDLSVLETYFDRLSKQAVIVGSGVVELFFKEAETARNRYLQAQAIKQEEVMRQNEELRRTLESANVFERITLGFKYTFIDPIASFAKNTAQWTGKGVVAALRMDAQFQVNKYAVMSFTRNLLANLASTFARETVEETKQTLQKSRVYIQERITGITSKLVATVSADQSIQNRNKDSAAKLQNIKSQIASLQEEIDMVRRARGTEQTGMQTEYSAEIPAPIPTLSPSPSPTPPLGIIDPHSSSGQFRNSPPEPQPNRAPEPVLSRAPEPASHPAETATPSPSPEPEETTQALPSPTEISEPSSSPGPSPSLAPSPDPESEVTAEPSPSLSPIPESEVVGEPSLSPEPEPSFSSEPSPAPTFFPQDVVINEIAWMGTRKENSHDEWIELYNTTDHAIDLTDWNIESPGGLRIAFTGEYQNGVTTAPWTEAHVSTIPPFGYFLVERTDDNTTSEAANWFFKGSLPNADFKKLAEERNKKEGLVLTYQDREIDKVSLWYAGATDDGYRTMERISAFGEGDDSENWNDNDGGTVNGMSAGSEAHPATPILGTPGKENSVAGSAPGQV